MLRITIALIFLNSVLCLNLCDDWIQYKYLKCFKVLEKKGTEEEALGNCTQLDQSSTLISIHSKEEQEFLNNILNKYNNISQNSWIGIKYLDETYKWMDNSINNYTNWSEDAVKDGTEQCVEMYLSGINFGKWTDVSCMKIALIVCQRNQEISLTQLKNIIEKQQIQLDDNKINFDNLKKVVEKQQTQMSSIIPIGFIYTQLMNQKEPKELWPQFKWLEVTKEYSGLFFRAEGGESLPFGQIQSQNQSSISDVHFHRYYYDSWNPKGDWSGNHGYEYYATLNQTKWIETNPFGTYLAIFNLLFYKTYGEVRPKNTAIKIFKRIE